MLGLHQSPIYLAWISLTNSMILELWKKNAFMLIKIEKIENYFKIKENLWKCMCRPHLGPHLSGNLFCQVSQSHRPCVASWLVVIESDSGIEERVRVWHVAWRYSGRYEGASGSCRKRLLFGRVGWEIWQRFCYRGQEVMLFRKSCREGRWCFWEEGGETREGELGKTEERSFLSKWEARKNREEEFSF